MVCISVSTNISAQSHAGWWSIHHIYPVGTQPQVKKLTNLLSLGKGGERCRSLGRGWECIISQSPFPSSLAFYFYLALILHKRSVWLVAIWKKKKRKKTEGKKEMPHGVISGVVLSSEAHRYNYMIQEWDKLRKVTHYV